MLTATLYKRSLPKETRLTIAQQSIWQWICQSATIVFLQLEGEMASNIHCDGDPTVKRQQMVIIEPKAQVVWSKFDEILTYHIEKDINVMAKDTDQIWNVCCVSIQQVPLHMTDTYWKGSKYNLLVKWENGESEQQ
jgi:hypothetical protein